MVEVNSYKGRDNSTIKRSYSTAIENFCMERYVVLPLRDGTDAHCYLGCMADFGSRG